MVSNLLSDTVSTKASHALIVLTGIYLIALARGDVHMVFMFYFLQCLKSLGFRNGDVGCHDTCNAHLANIYLC